MADELTQDQLRLLSPRDMELLRQVLRGLPGLSAEKPIKMLREFGARPPRLLAEAG